MLKVDFGEKNRIQSKSLPEDKAYITVPQIVNAISSLGLSLSIPEIEVLAAGFASDGEGGIDVDEFCEMIHALLYNILGSHAKEVKGKSHGRTNQHSKSNKRVFAASGGLGASTTRGSLGGPEYESKAYHGDDDAEVMDEIEEEAMRRTNAAKLVMKDLCDGILTFDK
jgi:hypothetical protein